ncbi:MAG TPA: FAD-dependent oxidoreductase [Rectinemataceae bacterium]|nr:FAD-dependent oxidoreductase [Rectinemataceae bacterium]
MASPYPRLLKVLSQRRLGGTLRLLVIERDSAFRAGQLLGLSLPQEGGGAPIAPRLYSIASGEEEDRWEILYSVEEEGLLTPRLSLLGADDTLIVEGPSGNFASGLTVATQAGPAAMPSARPPRGVLWVGGGTGIAPFVSLARSGRADGATLIHSASRPELFYATELFEGLLGQDYHRCCRRAPEGDARYFPGRATDFIAKAEGLGFERACYICGGSEFVVDTRAALLARGLPYSLIHAEVYF